MTSDTQAKAVKWLLSGNSGLSSKTMLAFFLGHEEPDKSFGPHYPHDLSDFGRCYKLIKSFPEFENRLNELSDIPKIGHIWKKIVSNWQQLSHYYEIGDYVRGARLLYECHT